VSAAPARGADAYARDPVVVAARSLHAAALELAPVAQGLRDTARVIRTRLDRHVERHALARSVLVADDSPTALAALVSYLVPLGAPVHAVTHDRTAAATLRGLGAAEVHVVHDYDAVPGLVHRYRCAVAVIDEHLGEQSGAELAMRLGRGPRVVLVTSHDGARDSLHDAARVSQAHAVIRTDAGEWGQRLRDEVLRALDDACGPPHDGQ